MRKITPILSVLIISLKNKFLAGGEAKSHFCAADTLRRRVARERVASSQRLIPPIKQRGKANRTFATGIRHGVLRVERNNCRINMATACFGGLGKPQQKPAKGPLTGMILSVLIIMFLGEARAAWIDDYFNSAVTTAPSAVKSQQRGYYMAGGYTARVPHKKEPIMTASLPTISVGCGGIDTFWGGISFMSPEYMVQKAKGVLQNAPYVLFSIGLKTLSTQFGDTIEAVQAIVDQLNQLQFDECSAAKGLVGLAIGENDATSGIMGEWDRLKTNTVKLKSGFNRTWDKVAKETNDKPREEKQKVVGMKITDPKAREFLTGEGYVLEKLASSGWEYITADEAAAIRAVVGDVYYNGAADEPKFGFRPGCASNLDFISYIYNPTPVQSVASLQTGGACEYLGVSINDRTVTILDALYSGYTDDGLRKSPFAADVLNFLNRAEIPVMAYFSTASMAGDDYLAAVKTAMGGVVSSGYAYGSLKNLSGIISKTVVALKNHMSAQEYFVQGFIGALNEYNKAIIERTKTFGQEYELVLNRLNTTFELTRKSETAAREIAAVRKNSYLFNNEIR